MKPYNTACIHLYMHPTESQELKNNLYIDGDIRDLKALLITAARLDENFYQALFESTSWIIRNEE